MKPSAYTDQSATCWPRCCILPVINKATEGDFLCLDGCVCIRDAAAAAIDSDSPIAICRLLLIHSTSIRRFVVYSGGTNH